MLSTSPHFFAFWQLLTRLGEAQVLLPAAALALWTLLRRPQERPLAWRWLLWLGAAVALTTLSKVAFIGWGIGWAAIDFTGVSGHAMFAAAIYPLLLGMLLPARSRRWQALAVAAGAVLALLVAVSRVQLHTHSNSEVIAGLLVGGLVGALALRRTGLPRLRLNLWLAPLAALWLVSTPVIARPSQSHEMVTRLALSLSGRAYPYTRDAMRRDWTQRRVL